MQAKVRSPHMKRWQHLLHDLQAAGCMIPAACCRLHVAGCKLQVSGFKLHANCCQLAAKFFQTSWRLPATSYRLPAISKMVPAKRADKALHLARKGIRITAERSRFNRLRQVAYLVVAFVQEVVDAQCYMALKFN
jgi:hypothetical protein